MADTVTLLDYLSFASGKPEDLDGLGHVTVSYTDGTSTFVWFPADMAAVAFAATVTWLKSRVGSAARIAGIEFDR